MMLPWRLDADKALAVLPHAVVGAVAAAAYMPERAIADTDFAVVETVAPQLDAHLRSLGWQGRGKLALADLEQIIALGRLEYETPGPSAGV